MTNITGLFSQTLVPALALLVYKPARQAEQRQLNDYVEVFDIDASGKPVNPRPLTDGQAVRIAKALYSAKQRGQGTHDYLQPGGILPTTVLFLTADEPRSVIWYTPEQRQSLFFVERLGIPNGDASVPALVWKASPGSLSIYAVADDDRPTRKTPLYRAPFFNVYGDGQVCMGTVKLREDAPARSLEAFMDGWEKAFFNSYFSHTNNDQVARVPIVPLWQRLIGGTTPFPTPCLTPTHHTLADLL